MLRSLLQILVVFISVAIVGSAGSTSIPGLDLAKLAPESQYILIGQVARVKKENRNDDTVTVRVVDRLRGEFAGMQFVLRLTPRGLLGFDVRLKEGQSGVFFLSAVDADNVATLVHPQSVALLSDAAFYLTD